MKLRMRNYQNGEDYWRIRQFLRDMLPLNEMRQRCWDIARFDYWFWHGVKNCEPIPLNEQVFLWEDQNQKIKAVLNPEGSGEAFLHVHPDFLDTELLKEMLTTAEVNLATKDETGKKKLTVWCNQYQTLLGNLLQENKYTKGRWVGYERRQALDALTPDPQIPGGYQIRPMGDGAELLERCYASGLIFHPDDIQYAVENRADVTWYRNIQNAPLYRRDLDLVAVAPDGAVAGFCTLWFDDVNRTGVFEPVGVAPAYQRRGLGKALMFSGLAKLKQMGAQFAFVGSYSEQAHALYASAGFTDYELSESWQREWPMKEER